MRVINLFLARPVLGFVLSLTLMLGGLLALSRLPVGLYPVVDSGVVTISARFPGASTELMNERVAGTLVSSVAGIDDVDYVTSRSALGSTEVVLHLSLGADVQKAFATVAERVRAVPDLPADMDPPEVRRDDGDRAPDYALAIVSRQMQPAQVTDYIERVVRPRLEAIPGVAGVEVLGSDYTMRVSVNGARLRQFNLSLLDVVQTLRLGNTQTNAGAFREARPRTQLAPETGLSSIEDFVNLPIGASSDQQLRLGDVARIGLTAGDPQVVSRFNDTPATVVFVKWRRNANPLDVDKNVRKTMQELSGRFPYDLQAKVLVDSTEYLARALLEVAETLLITSLIVSVAIYAGSGKLGAMIIPVIAIPLSLGGVCMLLWVAGYSLNTLTLLAMVLAIGLVVDDAIIVLDLGLNGLAAGMEARAAMSTGMRHVSGALISMTIVLAIAYLPLRFVGGLVQELFTEFATTLAGAVLISGVIAMTVTPAMCGWLLDPRHVASAGAGSRRFIDRANYLYARLVTRCLRCPPVGLCVWAVCSIGTVALLCLLPHELASKEDQGALMVVASAPTSATAADVARSAERLAAFYRSIPEIENFNYAAGVPVNNQLISFIRLTPWEKRRRNASEIQTDLQRKLAALPSLQAVVVVPTSLPGAAGMPYEFVIKADTHDYAALDRVSDAFLRQLRLSGLFQFVNKDLHYDFPRLHYALDRQLMARYGISAADVNATLRYAYSNSRLQTFTQYGRSYDVVTELASRAGHETEQLGDLQIRSRTGGLVYLRTLGTAQASVSPAYENSFQRQASVTISGALAPGVSLSRALALSNDVFERVRAPGMSWELGGESRVAANEMRRLYVALIAALGGIFVMLVAQFKSLRDPAVVILGSIPFAAFGALIALWIAGIALNIYTQIGILTLIGLITKQGILMVQAANHHVALGLNLPFAIVRACRQRFRAIVLTSASMLCASFPLLLASGPASVSRYQLGVVLFAGMLIGPLCSLFLLPVLYASVNRMIHSQARP